MTKFTNAINNIISSLKYKIATKKLKQKHSNNSKISQKQYYHGSTKILKNNTIKTHFIFDSKQNKIVKGAFLTDSQDMAKFFAIIKLLATNLSYTDHREKAIYIETLKPSAIQPYIYLYTINENNLNKGNFVHDKETEYYSTTDVKVNKIEKLDTIKTLKELGYSIYTLDKQKLKEDSLLHSIPTKLDIKQNKARREEFISLIKQKKDQYFKKINIDNLKTSKTENYIKSKITTKRDI